MSDAKPLRPREAAIRRLRGRGLLNPDGASLPRRQFPAWRARAQGGVAIHLAQNILLAVALTWGAGGCATQRTEPETHPTKQTESKNLIDIRAVRKEWIGKSLEEVARAMGRPDRQTGNISWDWWTYEGRFRDSVTNRQLNVVTFVFKDGKVVTVTY